jgi:mRNA-degrading endonuclease toxin of MazEF toxin-antitoxin module
MKLRHFLPRYRKKNGNPGRPLRPKLRAGQAGLVYDSWAKCDQVTTVAIATTVFPPLGSLDPESLKRIEDAIRIALVLP